MFIEIYPAVMYMADVHTKKKNWPETDTIKKVYKRKELVLLETYITEFH